MVKCSAFLIMPALASPILKIGAPYTKLPWEKRADGRYWTHVTLGIDGQRLDYWGIKEGKLFRRTEVVTADGLFRADSIASLAQLPVLLRHPKARYFNLNQEGLKIGQLTGSVAREDNTTLLAECVIDDYRAIARLDQMLADGQQPEASPCYHVDELVQLEAGGLGQIRGLYDHVAAPLFPGVGRGGRDIKLHLDSWQEDGLEGWLRLDSNDSGLGCEVSAALVDEPGALYFFGLRSDESDESTDGGSAMTTTLYSAKIGTATVQVPDEAVAGQINGLNDEATQLRADCKQTKADLAAAQAELGRVQAQLDQAKLRADEASKLSPKAIADAVQTHVKALAVIQQANPKYRADDKHWELSPFDLKAAAVVLAKPGMKAKVEGLRADSAQDEAYLNALFDMLEVDAAASSPTKEGAGTRLDDVLSLINAGRQEAEEEGDPDDKTRSDAKGKIDAETKRITNNGLGMGGTK